MCPLFLGTRDCLTIAPLADCGTPRIFKDASYKYLFRTGAHAAMDNVAAARYLLARKSNVKTVAGINQNYAWGQDSWNDFKASMQTLTPDVKIVTEQFPKLGAGQYGAEISALLVEKPDAVHSSFWGGDMEALILQGKARGFFENRTITLTAGETAMNRLATQIPNGVVIGARGADPAFREGLWARYFTAAPRPRTPSELRYSDRRLRRKELAARYKLNHKTVAKWRKRAFVNDAPDGAENAALDSAVV